MSWADAHGIAMISARQAHEDLQVPRDRYIDVFAVLQALEIEVVLQDLGPLLGLYVSEHDSGPACLLNSGLSEIHLRHTLAHELGHHRLQHGTTIDHEATATGKWGQGWSAVEKAAEMFASWFLMPLPAVLAACERIGARPASACDAYRVARWLGTPYATTVRHLAQLKIINRSSMSSWLRAAPAELARQLAPDIGLPAGPHVHLLAPEAHDGDLYAAPGDILRLGFPGEWDLPAPGFDPPGGAQDGQWLWAEPAGRDLQVSSDASGSRLLTASCDGQRFCLTVHCTAHRQGSDAFWAP